MKWFPKSIIKTQRGLTLVETLAVLVLISLVVSIIWTTITISVKHNNFETTKLQLQQEANFIITKLQMIHRKEDCYRLDIKKNEISVQSCPDQKFFKEVLGSDFSYGPATSKAVVTNIENSYELKLAIKDPSNAKLYVEIPTVISRYKGAGGSEDE